MITGAFCLVRGNLSSFTDQQVGKLRSLILTVTIKDVIVHLSFEEQVNKTFPGEANTAVKLYRAA